jgi:hypothetical protein
MLCSNRRALTYISTSTRECPREVYVTDDQPPLTAAAATSRAVELYQPAKPIATTNAAINMGQGTLYLAGQWNILHALARPRLTGGEVR